MLIKIRLEDIEMIDNKYKHLTSSERQIIEVGIRNGSSKKAIADTIGKDKSTIGKEIKERRILKSKCRLALECANYKTCKYSRICFKECDGYKPFKCKRRDRSPGACNGCKDYAACHFNKYIYSAIDATLSYRHTLISSREGFNISLDEIRRIGKIIAPLIKNGQSIEQIFFKHKDEIKVSVKTIYNYIEANLFKEAGIDLLNIDLRRKVSRKITRKRNVTFKERQDRSFLKSRTFNDFKNYKEENPDLKIVEIDTVYNDISNGPFIETFLFLEYGFLYARYQKIKTKEAMKKGAYDLLKGLKDQAHNNIDIIIADRGSEFYSLYELEDIGGLHRLNVFYCDPLRANQKGSLENKHLELRYILPKGIDLYDLGLTSQTALDEVLSHINSSPRKKLNGRSPIELMKFLDPKLWVRFEALGLKEIPKDEVILKPYLLKPFKK